MMKLFLKLMLFLVVLACAGPFFLKGPDGKPLMSLQQFQGTTLMASIQGWLSHWMQPSAASNNPENTNKAIKMSRVFSKVYKWRGSDGSWHYSDMNLSETNQGQEMYINPNANVLHLSDPKAAEKTNAAKNFSNSESNPNKISDNSALTSSGIPSTIPLNQVPQLIEQAKQVQGLVDQRQKQYDQLLNEQR